MASIKEMVDQYLDDNSMATATLAGELGMSRSALFYKLKGRSDFTLSEAYKLSRLLGCTLDELFDAVAA